MDIEAPDIAKMLVAIDGVAADVRPGDPAGPDGTSGCAASGHFVQFYDADAFLLDSLAEFVGTALREGEAAIVIATEPHRRGLDERLQAAGLDPTGARGRGQYLPLDAAATLSRFIVDGAPERERFMAVIGDVLETAAAGGRRVRAFGEMVALLALEGNQPAAARLEELWNELQLRRPFMLFCAYPMERLGGEAMAELLATVCQTHTYVIPAESFMALPDGDARRRAIAVLQQKARSLEAEVLERQRVEVQLREALAAERAARAAAEAALRVRDEFISIAAHELKTPITSLSGQAQLIQRRLAREGGLDQERTARALAMIAGQSDRLARLVGQLLDVTRLHGGKLLLERQQTDVAALVAQAAAAARSLSDRHQIAVTCPAELTANVDPLRLEQVLTNLLDNAVKYSPDGGPIDLALRLVAPDAIELSVRDRGLGIPPERRGQIFERFYQAHECGHRAGLGLGLFISRQIVELHGGRISAEFPADGGTRFVVRLPLASCEPAPSAPR